MNARKRRSKLLRKARFESFEEKLALSAQPVADFYLTSEVEQRVEMHFGQLEQHIEEINDLDSDISSRISHQADRVNQHLGDVHAGTGVNYVYNTYGFTGAGQTVAVIDSGVAWDHVALGGGFGSGQRVVGGYDFAENDADPYDDGPDGFHGTHVAGIIGSDNATYRGVAPEADIVALRVFDDNGAGYFSWVESALQWVHDHRNDFANPITTVNMSLGTAWNSDSIPAWTTIEDELAQLEQDGIFIAVSAGNSFSDYNTPGLSYPAASPYVVPVGSVTNAGSFSSFSQRHDRIIAAPGNSITSTVPDHVFGADGNPNDWGTASGTSMASPYVAGASVLVRQAMEFVGVQNISQDTIYDHIRDTADIFYDSATNANYHRLNVQAALDALMPEDDYGSTVSDAHSLGTLNSTHSTSGTIGTVDDIDYFTFVAGVTGTATLTTNGHNSLVTDIVGGGGTKSGNSLAFDVVSGQSYTVSIQSSSGIGHYNASVSLQASAAIDLGYVELTTLSGQNLTNSNTWYQFKSTRDGTLTASAVFDGSSDDIDLFLYDASNQLLASSDTSDTSERVDVSVEQGDTLFLRVAGTNNSVDLQFANLLSIDGDTATIHGTAEDDVFAVTAGSEHEVLVNNLRYVLNSFDVTHIEVNGAGGQDTATATGSTSNDTATLTKGQASLENTNYRIDITNAEVVQFHGGGGSDLAFFHDSIGDDVFTSHPEWSRMEGAGYQNYAFDFGQVNGYGGSGGSDLAVLHDSTGNDVFTSHPEWSRMEGNGYRNYAINFNQVNGYANAGGADLAFMHDSQYDDVFTSHPEWTRMEGTGYRNYAFNFEQVNGYSNAGGADLAFLYDSVNNDTFTSYAEWSGMQGSGYQNYAFSFGQVNAYANAGGTDLAVLFDSAGNDVFTSHPTWSRMEGDGYRNYALDFAQVNGYAITGGDDLAVLYDSSGNDVLSSHPEWSLMQGDGYRNYAFSFNQVNGYAHQGGADLAFLYDSVGNDVFTSHSDWSRMEGSGFRNYAFNFGQVNGYADAGGTDYAFLYDSLGNDVFTSHPEWSRMQGSGYRNYAFNFSQVRAQASVGVDRADVYDSQNDDLLRATSNWADIQDSSSTRHASTFDEINVYGTNGGQNLAELDAVDFLLSQFGDWAST